MRMSGDRLRAPGAPRRARVELPQGLAQIPMEDASRILAIRLRSRVPMMSWRDGPFMQIFHPVSGAIPATQPRES